MHHKHRFTRFLTFSFCFFSSVLLASPADTAQPIHIEADQAVINEKQGLMTYRGHVILRQGNIQLSADKVTVYSSNDTLQRIIAEGEPVHYSQKQPSSDTSAEAEVRGRSQRMEYDAISKQVLFLGQAEFWQSGNRFSGNRIQYDPSAERVIANAGSNSSQNHSQSAPRVSITLQPKTPAASSKP
jgi:lipopolysaccharide export system protein LptA